VHLVDLAQDTELRERAALIVDKILFTMSVNSFKGVLGSARAGTHAPVVTDGRLEPTSGVLWMLWGVGCPNPALAASVSLSCSPEYEMPTLFRAIATEPPEELLARERHTWEPGAPGCAPGPGEVNKVTFKTPDYMLCSALDYRPGEMGCREHVWQATLGPDAPVFVTHPPHASRSDVYCPNFWVGNRVLPRVAQRRDLLVAVHRLPQEDRMGFTHAFYPAAAFDEYALREGWAFARKGEGYLALVASQGLELVTRGPYAYRELRSYGRHNVWLCQMGRAQLDGDFAAFQEKVLALDVVFDDLAVRCETLRGERLSFGWQGALLVDGQEQPTSGFKHYENPYCVTDLGADQMNIRFGDWILQLDFA
jgi:hypothetical protein